MCTVFASVICIGHKLAILFLFDKEPREEILLNVLPKGDDGSCARSVCGAIRYRNYKMIIGRDIYMKMDANVTKKYDPDGQWCMNGWCDNTAAISDVASTKHHTTTCTPGGNYVYPAMTSEDCLLNGVPCLFDLARDPCEYHDLHEDLEYMTTGLIWKLEKYHQQAIYPLFRNNSENGTQANPELFDGFYSPWIRDEILLHPLSADIKEEDNINGDGGRIHVHNTMTAWWWTALVPATVIPIVLCILVTMAARRKLHLKKKRDGYSQIDDVRVSAVSSI